MMFALIFLLSSLLCSSDYFLLTDQNYDELLSSNERILVLNFAEDSESKLLTDSVLSLPEDKKDYFKVSLNDVSRNSIFSSLIEVKTTPSLTVLFQGTHITSHYFKDINPEGVQAFVTSMVENNIAPFQNKYFTQETVLCIDSSKPLFQRVVYVVKAL